VIGVTGASGQVGSRVARRLGGRGERLRLADRARNGIWGVLVGLMLLLRKA